MSASRFTVTTLLLIAIIVSALVFFFSVTMVDLAYHPAVNDYYPIEGTDLAIRYSSAKPSGIYRGDKVTGVLKLEGTFGYDWGAELEGEQLYLNEYRTTRFGLMFCDVVRIDLNSFEKELLFQNAVLRGRCASGELVCLDGALLPSVFPKTNALCRLYAMSAPRLSPKDDSAEVIFLDPASGEVLYRVRDESALGDDFASRYLERSLEEVRG